MNKREYTHQPNLIQLVIGGILMYVNKAFFRSPTIDLQIGKYQLLNQINKPDSNFILGIYTDGTSQYFVKTWKGYFKDTNFYNLLNEYLVNKAIYPYFECNKHLTGVTTPRALEQIQADGSFSVVFEYVDGTNLSSYYAYYQAKAIARILESLESVSREIKDEHQNLFLRRGAFSYVITLPILVLLALLHNIEEAPAIILSAFYCVKELLYSYTSELTLAHRDIGLDNVLVSGDTLYIIDLERFAFTYPLYDISSLGIEPVFSGVITSMRYNFMYVEDEFLKSFIFIRRAAFTSKISDLRRYAVGDRGNVFLFLEKLARNWSGISTAKRYYE